MTEALEFNCFILDAVVGQIMKELQMIDSVIAKDIFARLITHWRSGEVDGRPLVEVEALQRDRDRLMDHQTMVLDQLKHAVLM
jgi:hypothetical protein